MFNLSFSFHRLCFGGLFGIYMFVLCALLVACSQGVQRFSVEGAGGLLGGGSSGGVYGDSAANLPVPAPKSLVLEPVAVQDLSTQPIPPSPEPTTATALAPTPAPAPTPTPQQTNTQQTNNSDYLYVPPADSSVLDNSSALILPTVNVPIPKKSPGYSPPQPASQVASIAPTETSIDSSALRWPVKGKVISNFGEDQNGIANDGIDISVPSGTPVKAAEDGLVIYASNELKEYGNLILITHDGDSQLVTAYAYNEKMHVQKGDSVKRGEIIATSGASGNAKSPRLHFQVRKDKRPVDPSIYLGTN